MPTLVRTTQIKGICEALGQLIKNPKSLGLQEALPPRVLAVLTTTLEILREEINGGTSPGSEENDLAAELSQDADKQCDSPEEGQDRISFSRLLGRRMEQLHLSNYDVAVSLGCTIERVRDFITGVRAPTELHIAELALLLGVTQESLATAAKRKIESLAVAL